jgi:translocation and assembly module TamA
VRKRLFPLLLPLLLALVACGSQPHPLSGPPPWIGAVRLVGADHVEVGELRDGLGLLRAKDLGQPFAPYVVDLDRLRIESFYNRRGYFSAQVQSAAVSRGDRMDVTFTIAEGAQAKLVRVDISGLGPSASGGTAAPIDAPALRRLLPIDDGDPFDYDVYDAARPQLVTALQNQGYANARVVGLVLADRERAEAVIQYSIELGPFSRFGRITIAGVDGELERSVRSRLRFVEGKPYSAQQLEDSRGDLFEYGRFSLVRIEPTLGANDGANIAANGDHSGDRDDVVPVRVTLALAPPNDLRIGGGVGVSSLAYEARGQAVYGRAGWPTTLTNTRLELRPALVIQREDRSLQPRLDAIAGLDRADLLLPRVRGTAEAGFSYLALEAYTDYGPRFRLSLRAPLYRRIVRGSAGWQLQLLRFRDIDAALDAATIRRLGLDRQERLGFFEQSVAIELRDNPLAPRRGVYAELSLEEGGSVAGGAFRYLRMTPDVRGYLSLGRLTLAGRGRLGIAKGDIPVTQRFFAGGANSHRGFAERQLAPFASQGTADGTVRHVVYGGASALELSGELRFPLFDLGEQPFAGVAFLDAADVTDDGAKLSPTRLHLAAGGGLRAVTPIGAVRLDVGVRLNRYGDGEPDAGHRFAYHISIGEAF